MSSHEHLGYLGRTPAHPHRGWDAVVVTASNTRQAERFRDEIHKRLADGQLPDGPLYLVTPDPEGRRAGSGSATILGLAALLEKVEANERSGYWKRHRVLMIHAGGEARRLPLHSAQGRIFGVLPGEASVRSSVFDRIMAASTGWAQHMGPGVLVMPGDVLVEFDSSAADWGKPGVTAVALKQPASVGEQHGVYVADDQGRVYTVLQKPSAEEMRAAGAMLEDGLVAVDSGLLRLDPDVAERLAELAEFKNLPTTDLYSTVVQGLAGKWTVDESTEGLSGGQRLFWRALHGILRGTGFHCNVLEGQFRHVGTTQSFRKVAAGNVLDSVLGDGSEVGLEAVVVDCWLPDGVRVGRGAILQGLHGLPGKIEIPEDTVVHQTPVSDGEQRRGTVIRVYGVEDDPQVTGPAATWFGRPVQSVLEELGLSAAEVWPNLAERERSLWNARLFPLGTAEEAWRFARWMCGQGEARLSEEWRQTQRHSIESSSQWLDEQALMEARNQRMKAMWQQAAIALSKAGTDLRPMLSQTPGTAILAGTAHRLLNHAEKLAEPSPTEAASQAMQAAKLLQRAGFPEEAAASEERAMLWVAVAVERGVSELSSDSLARISRGPGREEVTVSAPARIDLGGGWSDTPPFCIDWGGTVLNIAIEIEGTNPIRCTARRLAERVVRCVSEETGEVVEWRDGQELRRKPTPGSTATIPQAALQVMGIAERWESMDHGLEIRTGVHLPLGSGLGTSSILAATVVQSLTVLEGEKLNDRTLSDTVMRLEQRMTTGGGWQDQAGGIYPGAKLLMTGPGFEQRIRVRPVEWSPARKAEFEERLVVCSTGIQRMAKNLLRQVVGSYLARETQTVQVLHSIKTLASEMAYAMQEGEWDYLGRLLDRHWTLNVQLDPHTTNGPIQALLERVRPWTAGAKLAGAGGGGFLMLLAKGPEEAQRLRVELGERAVEWRISETGLRVVA